MKNWRLAQDYLSYIFCVFQLRWQHRDWRRHQTLLLQSWHQEHPGKEITSCLICFLSSQRYFPLARVLASTMVVREGTWSVAYKVAQWLRVKVCHVGFNLRGFFSSGWTAHKNSMLEVFGQKLLSFFLINSVQWRLWNVCIRKLSAWKHKWLMSTVYLHWWECHVMMK